MLISQLASPSSAQEPVSYETVDGFSIVAREYRSEDKADVGVLILPDPEEGKKAWESIAEELRAAGYQVLVPDPRGTGESQTQRNQHRDRISFTSRELAAADLDGIAGLRYLRDVSGPGIDRFALIGSKTSSVAALRAITEVGVIGCLLVSPQQGASGWPETVEGPIVSVVGAGDLLGIEASGDLLEMHQAMECWIVDGRGLGVELLESRRDLIARWTAWIDPSIAEQPARP